MKIQLFKKAEGEDWEAIDDQYRCLAVPVMRLPQADWGVQENHTQQWIYCLPFAGCDTESLPEWIRCHWDVQAGRWVVVSGGGGFARIEFIVTAATTIDDAESPYDGMRELTVDVQSPSCNRPELLGATGIKVYEHIPLCLTGDESDAALVDRKGTAFEGLFTGAPCHFVLDGLCCPE